MAEYIERRTAIAKLTALEVTEPNTTMTDAKRLLADMPAADVAPVVRGRWIPNTDDFTPANRCSVCGYNDPEIAICGGTYQFVQRQSRSYCPECGAKMLREGW